jgi:hypothetical protein
MIQNSKIYTLFPSATVAPNERVPSASHPAGGVGGPFVPIPLTPPSVAGSPPLKSVPLKPKFVEPHKLKPDELVKLVESKGGLGNLRKFQIEIYQIRGLYPETRLTSAREFWDLLANQYGSRIEWKVL